MSNGDTGLVLLVRVQLLILRIVKYHKDGLIDSLKQLNITLFYAIMAF